MCGRALMRGFLGVLRKVLLLLYVADRELRCVLMRGVELEDSG